MKCLADYLLAMRQAGPNQGKRFPKPLRVEASHGRWTRSRSNSRPAGVLASSKARPGQQTGRREDGRALLSSGEAWRGHAGYAGYRRTRGPGTFEHRGRSLKLRDLHGLPLELLTGVGLMDQHLPGKQAN